MVIIMKIENQYQIPQSRYRRYDTYLYRAFNDFEHSTGGRLYGSQYQNLSGEERRKLLIAEPGKDGKILSLKKLVEVDFKGLHINILYHLIGINYPYDPYYLADYPDRDIRPIIKLALLILLNAKNKVNAKLSLLKNIKEEPALRVITLSYLSNKNNQTGISDKTLSFFIEDIFKKLEEKHKDISKYFYKSISRKLMLIDSQIAIEIIKTFLRKNILVLCVHDSFLIDKVYENELKGIMVEAYQKIITKYYKKIHKKEPEIKFLIQAVSK